MDKASIIKDAIEYIQELQEEERKLQTEISELESTKEMHATSDQIDIDHLTMFSPPKKKKVMPTSSPPSDCATSPTIDLVEVSLFSLSVLFGMP